MLEMSSFNAQKDIDHQLSLDTILIGYCQEDQLQRQKVAKVICVS